MRLGLLADIHGNLPALEAVVAELERIQPDAVVLNGDLINAVPFSAEVVDYVRAQDWAVVRGNHEFYYLDFGTPRALPGTEDGARWGQLHWLVEHMAAEQAAYLAMLPDERTLYLPGTAPLRVAHGVPGRNRVGFYNEQAEAAIAGELQAVMEPTLVSAHTHVQVDRQVRIRAEGAVDFFVDPHSGTRRAADGVRQWHVVNPGSVGLPLNGEPTAQFAVLDSVAEEVEPGGWRASHYRVAYDRRPALEAFETSGMMAVGGAITELFYWELVTAEPEIVRFYRWAREQGLDPEEDLAAAFGAYKHGTKRDQYIRSHDPRFVRSAW
jgi:predicted phosphodiesterase